MAKHLGIKQEEREKCIYVTAHNEKVANGIHYALGS